MSPRAPLVYVYPPSGSHVSSYTAGSVSLSFCTITKNIEANVTKFGTRGDLEVPSNVADFLFEKSKVKGAPVQCEKVVGMGLWVCAISVIKLA